MQKRPNMHIKHASICHYSLRHKKDSKKRNKQVKIAKK